MHALKLKFHALAVVVIALPAFLAAAPETSGFLQSRLRLSEGTPRTPSHASFDLSHLRVKLAGEAAPGVNVVVMPELVGGFQLLDAYATWAATDEAALTLQAGQFKFPFGLDRMAAPYRLARVDYSMIDTALFPGSAWDVGTALTAKLAGFRLDAAVIEGQGANLAAGSTMSWVRNDASGRLEWSGLDGDLTLGASIYQGLSQKTPWSPGATIATASASEASHTWSGGHLKAQLGRMAIKAEVIDRDDLLWGATAEPSLALTDTLSLIGYYDRVEDQASDLAGKTAMGGALAWQAYPKVKVTLDVRGTASGADQKPTQTLAQLQAQTGF